MVIIITNEDRKGNIRPTVGPSISTITPQIAAADYPKPISPRLRANSRVVYHPFLSLVHDHMSPTDPRSEALKFHGTGSSRIHPRAQRFSNSFSKRESLHSTASSSHQNNIYLLCLRDNVYLHDVKCTRTRPATRPAVELVRLV